ncbi:hypothetical protein scyTo_0000163 [Scyliorhinus torazame]|uniref:Uncharacterized protein n=1 Tax=Scyliorhinus torazame TaxID=75743 RepID=A0A401NRK5_SCYTO|nr:hypothetical protein [Scyliorhinus torazame]
MGTVVGRVSFRMGRGECFVRQFGTGKVGLGDILGVSDSTVELMVQADQRARRLVDSVQKNRGLGPIGLGKVVREGLETTELAFCRICESGVDRTGERTRVLSEQSERVVRVGLQRYEEAFCRAWVMVRGRLVRPEGEGLLDLTEGWLLVATANLCPLRRFGSSGRKGRCDV